MKNILLVSILFFLTPFVLKAAVVINEALYDPYGTDTGLEYIRLYNNGSEAADLTGWDLDPSSAPYFTFPSFTLNAQSFVNIHINTSGTNTDTDLYAGDSTGMHNDRGPIAFFNSTAHSTANLVDYIEYGAGGQTNESRAVSAEIWTAGDFISDVDAGYAIKLKTDGQDNNSSSDWEQTTPSIGQGDEPDEPEEEPQEPEESEEPTEEPEVPPIPFSGGTSNQPPIADAGNDIIAFIGEEITFNGSKSYDPDGSELAYEWNLGEGGVKNEAVITHQYYYPGTYLVTLMVYDGFHYSKDTITIEIYPKKVTINEFVPNPVGKDAGDEENPGEWIELYNDSDQIVNISDWQLDDEDGGSKPFVFPENTLISPKGFLVFSRQTTNIALNNDSDKVRLLLSTGIIFQEVSYEKAKEGLSSALTPQGFVWSTPTPGLPNIVITEDQAFEYEGSLQSETTSQLSGNVVLSYDPKDSTKGGWTYSTRSKNIVEEGLADQPHLNLVNLEESTDGNSKLILIVLTIIVVAFAGAMGILRLKKKA